MSIKDLIHSALFASIIVAFGAIPAIPIPLNPIPIHAQSLGIMLAGSVLGSKKGSLSCLLFLVLIVIGLPVLPGGRGGVGIFFGPTGGFLLGYPLAAYIIGLLFEKNWNKLNHFKAFIYIIAGGVAVLYTIEIFWLYTVFGFDLKKTAYMLCIFIPGDLIKAIIATIISIIIKRSYPLIG